jgi:hypothetical protein
MKYTTVFKTIALNSVCPVTLRTMQGVNKTMRFKTKKLTVTIPVSKLSNDPCPTPIQKVGYGSFQTFGTDLTHALDNSDSTTESMPQDM